MDKNRDNKKKAFANPIMEIISFDEEDIIVTSGDQSDPLDKEM